MTRNNAKILVTGGSGFLGSHLVERLLENGNNYIRVVARNEGKLVELQNRFPSVDLIMGDIADEYIAHKAIQNIDICYHLAAFKHAAHAEIHPYECIRSNIVGTLNLLEWFGGHEFVAMSTDKAAKPNGTYGYTKSLVEKLIEERADNHTRKQYGEIYRIVRCGNIMFSTGSVLALWKEALIKGLPIRVTNPEATRFFYTVDYAVDLVLGERELEITKAVQIGRLLQIMQEKYGHAVSVEYTGLQPGENLHELLEEGGLRSDEVDLYSLDELWEMV